MVLFADSGVAPSPSPPSSEPLSEPSELELSDEVDSSDDVVSPSSSPSMRPCKASLFRCRWANVRRGYSIFAFDARATGLRAFPSSLDPGELVLLVAVREDMGDVRRSEPWRLLDEGFGGFSLGRLEDEDSERASWSSLLRALFSLGRFGDVEGIISGGLDCGGAAELTWSFGSRGTMSLFGIVWDSGRFEAETWARLPGCGSLVEWFYLYIHWLVGYGYEAVYPCAYLLVYITGEYLNITSQSSKAYLYTWHPVALVRSTSCCLLATPLTKL